MSDLDSSIQAKGSKPSSVTVAFLKHRTFLQKFLNRFFSEQQDIEDVTQEAFLRAYMAEQKKAGGIERPKAYLFRIAKNIALTRLTRKSRQITTYIADLSPSVVLESGATAEEEAVAEESLGLYCQAVASLSDKCRQVFLLRKVHGLTHKEIAARLSLSVSSVEKYLRQGVLACRAYMREQDVTHNPSRLIIDNESSHKGSG